MLIKGNLSEPIPASVPGYIAKGLEWLKATDLAALPKGKTQIDSKMFAKLDQYTTRVPDSGYPEAHRKYADIHYIIEGHEEIAVYPLREGLAVREEYSAEKDLIFFEPIDKAEGEFIHLEKGEYLVLFTDDVHRPCGTINGVATDNTKILMKIEQE